ncbi:cleavage stimulation factor, 3' pre-RNA, subunit 1, partial [Homalodisca vitripennis]
VLPECPLLCVYKQRWQYQVVGWCVKSMCEHICAAHCYNLSDIAGSPRMPVTLRLQAEMAVSSCGMVCQIDVFSQNARYFASTSRDGSIKLWDGVSNRCVNTFVTAHCYNLSDIAGSPRMPVTLRLQAEMAVSSCGMVCQIDVFSQNARYFASTSRDGSIKLWDGVSNRCVNTFVTAHCYNLSDIAGSPRMPVTLRLQAEMAVSSCGMVCQIDVFSQNARYFASTSRDGSIKLWDGVSNRCVNTFVTAHCYNLSDIAGSPRMPVTLRLQAEMAVSSCGMVCQIDVFSQNARYFATSRDGSIKLWDGVSNRCVNTFVQLIVTTCLTLQRWQYQVVGWCVKSMCEHICAAHCYNLSDIAGSPRMPVTLRLQAEMAVSSCGMVCQIDVFSQNARYFASTSRDGSIKLWDGVSNRCVNTFVTAHCYNLSDIAGSPRMPVTLRLQAEMAVSSCGMVLPECPLLCVYKQRWQYQVVGWCVKSMCEHICAAHCYNLSDIAGSPRMPVTLRLQAEMAVSSCGMVCQIDVFSQNARYFASTSRDGSIKLWDGVSNRCVNTFVTAHCYNLSDIAGSPRMPVTLRLQAEMAVSSCGMVCQIDVFSQNARYFASTSRDGSIKLWDGVSNRCVNTFVAAHDGAQVCSIQFTRNAKPFVVSVHVVIGERFDSKVMGVVDQPMSHSLYRCWYH